MFESFAWSDKNTSVDKADKLLLIQISGILGTCDILTLSFTIFFFIKHRLNLLRYASVIHLIRAFVASQHKHQLHNFKYAYAVQ